ncbi:GNAT family N-acetyltransferase [Brevibacterium linens]|uniref:Lysine N-acyltransferase MbtK n=1 Tax=Brevibacterium linens TaxID=1703 RepID=A0A0B9AN56_BRELN|nr:GNAT family N-acetyltransferase [Brevibacterium linens]KHS50760.1 Siderophore biosynthesis protein, conserved region [Brevibacterium linens]
MEFRRTTRADFPLLARWLGTPHVARFWNHETTPEAIERDFGGSVDGTEPSDDFIVEDAGVPVGFIQRSRICDYADEHIELIALADAPQDALTIDYFIGEGAATGRGVGTRMIREFTDLCFADWPAASAIIVPVIAGNPASWKALAAAGYERIAEGHIPPDNPIDDGWHVVYRRDRS